MPRLLLFAPCQKAVIDRDDDSASLIAILSGMAATHVEGQTIPPDEIVPFAWAAVAVWERSSGDEGKAFVQRMEIVLPDGTLIGNSIIEFTFVRRMHQNVIRGTSFPIGQPGMCFLRLAFQELGYDDWTVVNEYPFEVEHRVEVGTETGGEPPPAAPVPGREPAATPRKAPAPRRRKAPTKPTISDPPQ